MGSLSLVMQLLRQYPLELKITRPRKTKFGDYRLPKKNERHRISINANLNPYAFLITLVHEVAHLKAFSDHGLKIKPHGSEWQDAFRKLSQPFLEAGVFPNSLQNSLEKSLRKATASSCTDLDLFRELKSFDELPENIVVVEEVEEGSYFKLGKDKIFKRGPLMRKRYRCLNMTNGREYMVHPLAQVQIVKNQK